MFRVEARAKIEQELSRAEAAREAGLEGRARVCARRAAGAAVREYLEQQRSDTTSLPQPGMSAYDLLAELQSLPGVDPEILRVVDHMLAKVDENFSLPVDVDLLAEARWLVQELEKRSA